MSFTANDVEGLELPDAWRTSQTEDPNFDISRNKLNNTIPRTLFLSATTINWKQRRLVNLTDPIDDQDAATKIYVDQQGAALWATFDAVTNVNMAGFVIQNLSNPSSPQEAATADYVDNSGFAKQLTDLSDVNFPIAPTDGQFMSFNAANNEWRNVDFSPGSPTSIVSPDTNTSVATFDGGPINFTVAATLSMVLTSTELDIRKPVTMNNFRISDLLTPSALNDAANKDYVDTQIPLVIGASNIDDLLDVTFDTTPLANQVMVNDGSVWRNQLLTKAQLLNTIPYTDETNTFDLTQTFSQGFNVAANQNVNLLGAFMSNVRDSTYNKEDPDPPNPTLSDSTLFFGPGTDFGSVDPLWQVLIDRGGVIQKKPVITSETIFALNQFTNGMFTQETGVDLVAGAGTTIRVRLFNENNAGEPFDVVLDGKLHEIPDALVNPGVSNTIELTEGTDVTPSLHYVWIQLDVPNTGSPVMTQNTTGFPTNVDFAVIGKFLLPTQATTISDGPYAALSPDYEVHDEVSRGHLAHINDRLNELDAAYISGIDITTNPIINTPQAGAVEFQTTTGKSFELHPEDIEAFDSTLSTSLLLVVNEGTQTTGQFTRVTDLGDGLQGLTLADGVTTIWQNNQRINLVLFTIHNDDEPNTTNYGVNLPVSAYSTNADAIDDVNNFAIKTIPNDTRGLAMLIAEIVIDFASAGTTYEIIAIKDLRGQIPGAASSGGGAGGGATQLNELSDVTIGDIVLAVGQVLEFQADSQWKNVANPAGLLVGAPNTWTGFQDYTEVADPGAGASTVGRFFVERIDGTNVGLFVYLEQSGVVTKVRLA